jgi:uncharacterized membrane protein YhaH (DUF805 family)
MVMIRVLLAFSWVVALAGFFWILELRTAFGIEYKDRVFPIQKLPLVIVYGLLVVLPLVVVTVRRLRQ